MQEIIILRLVNNRADIFYRVPNRVLGSTICQIWNSRSFVPYQEATPFWQTDYRFWKPVSTNHQFCWPL